MSDPGILNALNVLKAEVRPDKEADEIRQGYKALLTEVEQLRLERLELSRKLAEAETGSRVDRETRRAALNLMEDAVNARRAEQHENHERRRAEESLREADRRKDEFLATLAHELRNPLAPIRNSLHILRLGVLDHAASEHVHAMLERQVSHMVRLVDDLMEVSRITRGQIELRPEAVALKDILLSAIEISRPLFETAGHQLSIRILDEPLNLMADPVRLSQVFANLLNNAAKYTNQGGKVQISAWQDGSDVVVSVRDNGIGIPGEMLSHVFRLFTQVDQKMGRCHGGLGIGLTIVKKLVDAHGGSIEARSEGPGRGSEFLVRLPHAEERNVNIPSTPAQEPLCPMAARRIMVVDDNQDAARSLGILLSGLGATVSTTNDGKTALLTMQSFQPSVILLDIGMPEMDGNEVARRIRQQPQSDKITLIALTGWGQEADRRKTREAGFNYHLIKPVDPRALQALLAELPAEQTH
jgi:signal transduction histidine kinase/CheY-like chemotaxis protein